MKKLLLLLVILSNTLFSQKTEGVLTSENEVIPFANVVIFSADDSAFVSAAFSDSLGYFETVLPAEKNYYLYVQALGFLEFYSQTFQSPKNFSSIAIQKDKTRDLDEVTITVQKPMFEKTGRGIVVNVDASPILSSGNTQNVLEKIPGVIMNNDGSLTLKGRQNVQIFIDGKPTFMSTEDLVRLLENTPATEIEKIEVFETPPACFEASGNAGIINIVRKKGTGLGFKGNIGGNIGYGNYHKLSPWAYVNYRSKKINTYGSTWYYNSMFDFKTSGNMQIVNNNEASFYLNQAHRIHHSVGTGVRYGMDYFLTKKTTIGYLGLLYNGQTFGLEPSTVDITGPASSNYDFIDANQDFDYSYSGQTHNINVKHEINKNSSINVDLDYINRNNNNETATLNDFFVNNTQKTPFFFRQDGTTNSEIFVGKVDYNTELPKKWNLETGAQASQVNIVSDFNAFEGTSNDDAIEDLNQSNTFEYDENITSSYLVFTKKWEKYWSVDIGARIENTRAKGYSLSIDSSFTRNYTNVFPNVSLAYTVDKKYNLSLAGTRRIQRPAYHQLNPFTSQTNQFNFRTGNPFLNPQFTDQATFTWGLRNKYYFTWSASQTLGLMTQVVEQQDALERQINSIENLDDFYNFSFNATIPVKIKRWWTINWNTTIYHNILNSELEIGSFEYELTSFNLQMQQMFTLTKGWKMELSGFYNHDSYWNIFFVDPHYKLDLGFSKKINKLNIAISFQDFLNLREGNGGVFQNNIEMPTTYKPESRILRINLNYAFGNQGVKKERRRSTGSEDLLKRAE